jgi:alpha-1,3-rhamnosyltransferase
MEELISVVIPCYNHQDYVQKSIESILHQSYTNFELVVIDDGSKDNSPAIIESLATQYNFQFICQSNVGICKTLNRAIKDFTKGSWIAIVASDDYWHIDKLKLQMDRLKANSSEFCYTKALEFSEEPVFKSIRVFPTKTLEGNILKKVFIQQHIPAGSILFSRNLYNTIGGFDESLREEDWDFVIRSAAFTNIVAVDKPLLYYRSHSTNFMKVVNRKIIFQQKAKLLAKNMHLVSPFLFIFGVFLHFSYDIVYCSYIKKWLHL